jgi:hypothetical protein
VHLTKVDKNPAVIEVESQTSGPAQVRATMVSPSETRVDTEPLLEVLVSSCYFADFVPSLGELAFTLILFIVHVRSNTIWVG